MLHGMMRMLCPAVLLTTASLCRAGVPVEVVDLGKQATALVEVGDGQASGSAFCIDAAGLFVTNEHVAAAFGDGQKLSLVLRPGEKDQKILTAKVVRQDKEADLALLQVDSHDALTALAL